MPQMETQKLIQKWEEKHSLLLNEYSKGNANNEVMKMYRTQMKNILDFINDLKSLSSPTTLLPTRKVCFFALKKGKYITENGMEITTEMLVKYPHQIDGNWNFIILD